MSREDYFKDCQGMKCNMLGLYYPIYVCHGDHKKYCSQREYYEGEDKILRKYSPYCKSPRSSDVKVKEMENKNE